MRDSGGYTRSVSCECIGRTAVVQLRRIVLVPGGLISMSSFFGASDNSIGETTRNFVAMPASATQEQPELYRGRGLGVRTALYLVKSWRDKRSGSWVLVRPQALPVNSFLTRSQSSFFWYRTWALKGFIKHSTAQVHDVLHPPPCFG